MSSKLNLQSPVLTIEHLNHVLETGKDNAYNVVMEIVEKPLLELTLTHTRGNQTKAAEILGLNRGTLRKKLKAHGLMK
ncbi:protein ninH [Acinetobacter sp. NRRL B-65365]|uniref:helix-turn-helix domain-containing protein n=1 Tax=Acinetobacter sp. NRRL B-65365 TaxID=1785092 RepID=UPI0007A0D289|nr:helix-turn-helix domain-containing protein [Acinetobacter sp. NRRL B-65365]KYQ82501.1 protein ninH [Acinetobacter sp. NRRL B-65365]